MQTSAAEIAARTAAGPPPGARRGSIVVVGPGPGNRGGIAAAIAAIVSSPLADRYRLDVVSTTCPGSRARKALHGVRALAALARLLARGAGEVVHVNSASRASLARKAAFVAVARAARRPVVFHVHGGGFLAQLDAGGPGARLARWALRRADVVVALTPRWAEELAARSGARPAVVPNAVAVAAAAPRVGAAPPTIAFLGDLRRGKGVFDLVEAYAALRGSRPGLRLVLAGAGADGDALARRARELGAGDGVVLPGWLGAEAKRELLAGATCFALPSYAEGLPLALLEAMAAGVPVVAAAVGGIPDAVRDGVDGLLVPPGDLAALAAALATVLDDGAAAARLAAAGRARVEAEFGPAALADRLAEVYERALARRRAAAAA